MNFKCKSNWKAVAGQTDDNTYLHSRFFQIIMIIRILRRRIITRRISRCVATLGEIKHQASPRGSNRRRRGPRNKFWKQGTNKYWGEEPLYVATTSKYTVNMTKTTKQSNASARPQAHVLGVSGMGRTQRRRGGT